MQPRVKRFESNHNHPQRQIRKIRRAAARCSPVLITLFTVADELRLAEPLQLMAGTQLQVSPGSDNSNGKIRTTPTPVSPFRCGLSDLTRRNDVGFFGYPSAWIPALTKSPPFFARGGPFRPPKSKPGSHTIPEKRGAHYLSIDYDATKRRKRPGARRDARDFPPPSKPGG